MGTARQTSAAEDQNQTSAGAVRRQTTFLTEIRIDFGPPQLLGQFFLRADAVVRQRGIRLEFAPIADLVDLNRANKASWGVFAQTLDSRYTDISAASSYCLLGRNEVGEVVAAQAGRLYSLRDRSLQDIADDASLYYGDRKPDVGGISCRMTAPSARSITGRIVYSGALWVRPDYRGRNLAAMLPRISRAFALSRWGTDFTIAFMSPQIAASPLASAYGYRNVEPSYTVFENGAVVYEGLLAWMDAEALVADLFDFSQSLISQVD